MRCIPRHGQFGATVRRGVSAREKEWEVGNVGVMESDLGKVRMTVKGGVLALWICRSTFSHYALPALTLIDPAGVTRLTSLERVLEEDFGDFSLQTRVNNPPTLRTFCMR